MADIAKEHTSHTVRHFCSRNLLIIVTDRLHMECTGLLPLRSLLAKRVGAPGWALPSRTAVPRNASGSEIQVQAELQSSAVHRRTRDHSEVRLQRIGYRLSELGMVQHIERIRLECEPGLLGQRQLKILL
jgi:hypothetical protein